MRGFTLIELLVVISIMVIVTSVLVVRQAKFDSSTLLRSLAYSMALSVRQAQVYGTSTFGTTTAVGNCTVGTYTNGACFAQGYGINVAIGSPSSYVLYADLNNNGTYDNGEVVKLYNLGQGYTLSQICATNGSGTRVCSGAGGVTSLSINFRRPNPDACITTNLNAAACAVGAVAAYATSSVQVQNTGDPGSSRSIYISATGQITVGTSGT